MIPGTLVAAGLAWWVLRRHAAAALHHAHFAAYVDGTGAATLEVTPASGFMDVISPDSGFYTPLTPDEEVHPCILLDAWGRPYPDDPTPVSLGPALLPPTAVAPGDAAIWSPSAGLSLLPGAGPAVTGALYAPDGVVVADAYGGWPVLPAPTVVSGDAVVFL